MIRGAWVGGLDESILLAFYVSLFAQGIIYLLQQAHAVVQAGFEFEILLPQTPKCWD